MPAVPGTWKRLTANYKTWPGLNRDLMAALQCVANGGKLLKGSIAVVDLPVLEFNFVASQLQY